jgi:hypothetical protein
MGESLQRQRVQLLNMFAGGAFSLYVEWLFGHRKEKLTPKRRAWIWVVTVCRSYVLLLYYLHNKRFYDDVKQCVDAIATAASR